MAHRTDFVAQEPGGPFKVSNPYLVLAAATLDGWPRPRTASARSPALASPQFGIGAPRCGARGRDVPSLHYPNMAGKENGLVPMSLDAGGPLEDNDGQPDNQAPASLGQPTFSGKAGKAEELGTAVRPLAVE